MPQNVFSSETDAFTCDESFFSRLTLIFYRLSLVQIFQPSLNRCSYFMFGLFSCRSGFALFAPEATETVSLNRFSSLFVLSDARDVVQLLHRSVCLKCFLLLSARQPRQSDGVQRSVNVGTECLAVRAPSDQLSHVLSNRPQTASNLWETLQLWSQHLQLSSEPSL